MINTDNLDDDDISINDILIEIFNYGEICYLQIEGQGVLLETNALDSESVFYRENCKWDDTLMLIFKTIWPSSLNDLETAIASCHEVISDEIHHIKVGNLYLNYRKLESESNFPNIGLINSLIS